MHTWFQDLIRTVWSRSSDECFLDHGTPVHAHAHTIQWQNRFGSCQTNGSDPNRTSSISKLGHELGRNNPVTIYTPFFSRFIVLYYIPCWIHPCFLFLFFYSALLFFYYYLFFISLIHAYSSCHLFTHLIVLGYGI
jgi:hypothetical protein